MQDIQDEFDELKDKMSELKDMLEDTLEEKIKEALADSLEEALGDKLEDVLADVLEDKFGDVLADVLEDKLGEILEDELEDKLEEAMCGVLPEVITEALNDYFTDHELVCPDGTIVKSGKKTKVLSPDKSKMLICYGGLKVKKEQNNHGIDTERWALWVQSRISCWDVIAAYDTKEEAITVLQQIKDGMKAGEEYVEI